MSRLRDPRPPIARTLVSWGVSADAVSVAGLVLACAAAVPLALAASLRCPWSPFPEGGESSVLPLVAGLLLAVSGLLDVIDGPVARQAGTASPAGALLDSVLDRVADLVVHAAIVAHAASRGDAVLATLAVVAFSHGVLIAYLRSKAEIFGVSAAVGFWQRPERCGLLVAGCALGHVREAVAILATLPLLTVVLRFRHARHLLSGAATRPSLDRLRRGTPAWLASCLALIALLLLAPALK